VAIEYPDAVGVRSLGTRSRSGQPDPRGTARHPARSRPRRRTARGTKFRFPPKTAEVQFDEKRAFVVRKAEELRTGRRAAATKDWARTGEFADAGRTDALEWSPDGARLARSWRILKGDAEGRGVELRGTDGKQLKNWPFEDLSPALAEQTVAVTLRYTAADQLVLSAHGLVGKGRLGALGVVLDPTTRKATRRFSDTGTPGMYAPYGAASPGGKLAATTIARGLAVAVYRLSDEKDGAGVVRCGDPARRRRSSGGRAIRRPRPSRGATTRH